MNFNAYFSILSIAVLVTLASCTGGKEQGAEGWPELDAYHDVMAGSYHPVADSNNMEPARRLASRLDSSAQVLFASKADANDTSVLELLTTLRDSSAAFNTKVKANLPDSILRPSLTRLHHVFHELMESGGGEMKHHK